MHPQLLEMLAAEHRRQLLSRAEVQRPRRAAPARKPLLRWLRRGPSVWRRGGPAGASPPPRVRPLADLDPAG